MSNFREFEISNFLGIASSNRHPQKNECQECKNFDTRYIDGDLTLRPGFSQKYAAPASADHRSKLSAITYLAFQNFVPEGTTQEVTIWVAKATLAGETAISEGTPTSRGILAIFSSHQFNGTSWVEKNWDGSTTGKYWLNHTIVTKIGLKVSDGQYQLDTLGADLVSDKLNNWTIINITKSPYEVAQIIDTYDVGTPSGQVGIYITNFNNDWSVEDEVVLMRNYIPYDNLISMYSCTANDISFHKVLNDLKIGFGGQSGRIGLSIGYRKSALLLGSIEFGGFSAGQIEALATINNIAISTYVPTIGNQYKINIAITTGSGNELVAGEYFFKLTGLVDGFNEVLLADTNVTISSASDLIITPSVRLGDHHINISKLRLFVATTNIVGVEPTDPYYLLKEYTLSQLDYSAGAFNLSDDGTISIPQTASELHTDHNAAIPGAIDYNALNGTGSTGFFVVNSVTLAVDNIEQHSGTYCVKISTTEAGGEIKFVPGFTFYKGNTYKISFYAKSTHSTLFIVADSQGHFLSNILASTYPTDAMEWEVTFQEDADYIVFTLYSMTATYDVYLDDLSIKREGLTGYTSLDIPASGSEMFTALGYAPTFNMVKSWDQAIVTQGRVFFVNPYIDKRYENKIFRSHISGAGAFMYDVASAGEYIDLENFDGNSLVGIEVLPNLDFIALKTNGSQRVDPNTGSTREISLSSGCNSRRSIVNFGDKVVWCSDHDIHASDGLNTVSMADKSIREEYRVLIGGLSGNKIFATRETKDNAYRFLMNAPALEKEYILTKKGWIVRENANSLVPDYYSTSQDGTVWFMDSGIIYFDSTGVSLDNATSLTASWKSVEIDAELMGEGLSARDFIGINEAWADFTTLDNLLLDLTISVKLYLDGTLYKTFTHTASHASGSGRKKLFSPMTTKNCRRFSIEVTVTGTGVLGTLVKLHSVGVMWKPIFAGHYN